MSKKHMTLLHAKGKSKKPVEDTVRRCWSDIVIAVANGHSRAKIREALEADGHHVGVPSGFNAALVRVAKEHGVVLNDLGHEASDPRQEDANDPPSAANMNAALEPPLQDDVHERPLTTDDVKERPPLADDVHDRSPSTDTGERTSANKQTTSPFADTRYSSKF